LIHQPPPTSLSPENLWSTNMIEGRSWSTRRFSYADRRLELA
jgi:hypothetical protein